MSTDSLYEVMYKLLVVEEDLEAHVFGLVLMENDLRENEHTKYGYSIQERAEYASRNCELSAQRIKNNLHYIIDELDKYLTTIKE